MSILVIAVSLIAAIWVYKEYKTKCVQRTRRYSDHGCFELHMTFYGTFLLLFGVISDHWIIALVGAALLGKVTHNFVKNKKEEEV